MRTLLELNWHRKEGDEAHWHCSSSSSNCEGVVLEGPFREQRLAGKVWIYLSLFYSTALRCCCCCFNLLRSTVRASSKDLGVALDPRHLPFFRPPSLAVPSAAVVDSLSPLYQLLMHLPSCSRRCCCCLSITKATTTPNGLFYTHTHIDLEKSVACANKQTTQRTACVYAQSITVPYLEVEENWQRLLAGTGASLPKFDSLWTDQQQSQRRWCWRAQTRDTCRNSFDDDVKDKLERQSAKGITLHKTENFGSLRGKKGHDLNEQRRSYN